MSNDHVTIISVGVEKYSASQLKSLAGPRHDLINIRRLLTEDHATAIFKKNQFIEVINPTLAKMNSVINEYILSRSANKDILFFYFSGHGIPLRNDDLGLCMTDSIIEQKNNVP